MKDFIHTAILNLDSNVGSIVGNTLDEIVCLDRSGNTVKINESNVRAEAERLQEEFDALKYQRDRHYPSIGDQLDMQYHDELNGTTTWKDAVAKVKADNPKPE